MKLTWLANGRYIYEWNDTVSWRLFHQKFNIFKIIVSNSKNWLMFVHFQFVNIHFQENLPPCQQNDQNTSRNCYHLSNTAIAFLAL